MEGPNIKIQPEAADKFMNLVSPINLLLTIFLSFWIYIVSPEIIPAHYNIHGEINGYAGKSVLFIMPAIAIFLFTILKVVIKHPKLHNYMQVVTDENAEDLYKGSSRMLRLLNMLMMTIFLFFANTNFIRNKIFASFLRLGLESWNFPVCECPSFNFYYKTVSEKNHLK